MKIRKETPRDKFICQSGGSFSYLRSNAIARKSKIFERPRGIAYVRYMESDYEKAEGF